MRLALLLVAFAQTPGQDPPPDELALLEGRVLVEREDGARVPLEKGSLLVEYSDQPGRRSIDVRDGRFAWAHDSLDVVVEVVSVQVRGGRARVPGGRAELRFLEGPPTLVIYELPSYGAERLDELYLLEGEVLLDEGPGAPVPVERGVLRFRLDGKDAVRVVEVVDGRFELVESRTDLLYQAVAVELEDGRFGAFYEAAFPFHFEDGTARVLAQPVRATRVTVRDAATEERLAGVVFEARDPQRQRPEYARDPQKTMSIPTAVDGQLVPRDPRTTRYRVRVPGYTPVWIDVDPFAGGLRTVGLVRSGTARLQYRGVRASDSWDVLRVRDAEGTLVFEGRFTGRLGDLPAGELRFRLEGQARENPFVWGEGQGTIPVGGEATIEVIAWEQPRYTAVTLAGQIVVPPGWEIGGASLVLVDEEQIRLRTRRELGPDALEWTVAASGTRRAEFRLEGLAPGGYRVELGDLRARLRVPPWGDESSRLVLPELARVTIAVVERSGGRPVDGGTVNAGLAPYEGAHSYRIDVPARRLGPGEFVLDLPAGEATKIDVRPENHRRAQLDRTYAAGDHREVIEVEPRMGVAFALAGIPAGERDPALTMTLESGPFGGELIWPRTARNAVEVTLPGSYLLRLQASGYEPLQVSIEIATDELVQRELRLEPLDR